MIVGEAPGKDEEIAREGFVGRSGRLLRSLTRWAGLREGEVAYANVVACRPPDNKFPGAGIASECISRHLGNHMKMWGNRPVLAAGVNSIEALTGLRLPILTARGSLLPRLDGGWLVGTVHPAFLLRGEGEEEKGQSQLSPLVASDIERAITSTEPFIPRIKISTPEEVAAEFDKTAFDRAPLLAIDIEGSGRPNIVGVGWDPNRIYVMRWGDEVKCLLTRLTEECIPVFHNAAYDVPELEQAGVPIPSRWFDTINTSALIDPDVSKALQSQVLTHVPNTVTWKNLVNHENLESDSGKVAVYRKLWQTILHRAGRRTPSTSHEWYCFYNGLDVGYSLALAKHHMTTLAGRGEYYTEVMMPLQRPLLIAGLRGLPVNPKRLEFHRQAADRLVRMAKAKLDKAASMMLASRYEEALEEVSRLEEEREAERASQEKRTAFSKASELTKARNKMKAAFEAYEAGFNFDSPPQRIALIEALGLPCPTHAGSKTTKDDKLEALISRLQRGTLKAKGSTNNQYAIEVLRAMIAAKGWATWSRNFLQPPMIGA